MTEQQLYTWLRKAWTKDTKNQATRLESWIGKGIPDVNWVIEGWEFWTELKIVLPTGKFQEPLKVEQSVWLLDHTRAGGLAWIVAREHNPPSNAYFAWWGGDAHRILGLDGYAHGINQLCAPTPGTLLNLIMGQHLKTQRYPDV